MILIKHSNILSNRLSSPASSSLGVFYFILSLRALLHPLTHALSNLHSRGPGTYPATLNRVGLVTQKVRYRLPFCTHPCSAVVWQREACRGRRSHDLPSWHNFGVGAVSKLVMKNRTKSVLYMTLFVGAKSNAVQVQGSWNSALLSGSSTLVAVLWKLRH